MDADQISSLCKALGEPNRLKIVQMLSDREQCACVMLEKFNITQPTLSHHMKILCESGVVVARKDGKWTYYAIDKARGDAAAALLQSYTDVQCDAHDLGCAP